MSALHPYDEAIARLEAVLRLECPGRRLKDCEECGALFLPPPQNYGAAECQRCYLRVQREADEAWEREAYRRHLEAGGSAFVPAIEAVPAAAAQGSLF